VTAHSSRFPGGPVRGSAGETRPAGAPRVQDGPAAGEGRLRLDARRNRQRILAAAREVFADQGIDAPMATVARRAGVGVATLYRRFPTRDDLVRHAFADQMTACGKAFAQAVADPDPWRGLRRLMEELCRLQREERGFPRRSSPRSRTTRQHTPQPGRRPSRLSTNSFAGPRPPVR
jgi:AcrR family transcriptional regulator